MLSRRTVSDVASLMPSARGPAGVGGGGGLGGEGVSGRSSSVEAGADGAVRLRMRLPKAEVARLMKESRDPAEAAERIMQLCVARDQGGGPAPSGPARHASAPVSALYTGKTAVKKEVSIFPSRDLACVDRARPPCYSTFFFPKLAQTIIWHRANQLPSSIRHGR
jgi:hypothetical protein